MFSFILQVFIDNLLRILQSFCAIAAMSYTMLSLFLHICVTVFLVRWSVITVYNRVAPPFCYCLPTLPNSVPPVATSHRRSLFCVTLSSAEIKFDTLRLWVLALMRCACVMTAAATAAAATSGAAASSRRDLSNSNFKYRVQSAARWHAPVRRS